MPPVALITGVTGQDGSYLAEFLLAKNYKVYGLSRYCSEEKQERLVNVKEHPSFFMLTGDLTDTARITDIIRSLSNLGTCVEVYNLGAQSHVKLSFEQPEFTSNVDALGTLRILEAIRQTDGHFKFYQACTSEMFGKIQAPIQNEETPFYPRSPYGVSKVFGYWITKNYRESYNLFACNGILFNHESERRGLEFVTRKVTRGLAKWQKTRTPIILGNIDAKRDWGHAEDYIEAMWLMLQQELPDDYVVGTGETHTVREFIEEACQHIGTKIQWVGQGENEIGRDVITGDIIIRISPEFYRPSEVDVLVGDASKALRILGWSPRTSFQQLVQRMMDSDKEAAA